MREDVQAADHCICMLSGTMTNHYDRIMMGKLGESKRQRSPAKSTDELTVDHPSHCGNDGRCGSILNILDCSEYFAFRKGLILNRGRRLLRGEIIDRPSLVSSQT